MPVDLLRAARLFAAIHRIEIFRLKHGGDYVALYTNLPNPRAPYVGGLILNMWCDRGCGPDWVRASFPGVETSTYDYTSGRTPERNPAPSESSSETLDSLDTSGVGGTVTPHPV